MNVDSESLEAQIPILALGGLFLIPFLLIYAKKPV